MTSLGGDNYLPDLAARIRAEHAGALSAAKRSVEHAIAAGELLIEAKAQLKHGQWLPWLRDHCDMSERTARAYMRVARNKDKLGEIGNVADLSLRGAIGALTEHLAPDDVAAELAEIPPRPLELGSANFQSMRSNSSQISTRAVGFTPIWSNDIRTFCAPCRRSKSISATN